MRVVAPKVESLPVCTGFIFNIAVDCIRLDIPKQLGYIGFIKTVLHAIHLEQLLYNFVFSLINLSAYEF